MGIFSQDAKVSQSVLNAHYYWGLGAIALLLITAGYAGLELWRVGKPSEQALTVLLGLAGLTVILMIFTDEMGWEINHHELEQVVTPAQAATATPQAWSHVHMILNHFPTVGWVTALTFYLIALVANNDGLKRASLAVFVTLAIVGVPTYVTGAAAMWALTVPPIPGISKAVINAHRDFALWTLFGLGFTGVAAWAEI